MIGKRKATTRRSDDEVSAEQAAAYIVDLSFQLAGLAREKGLLKAAGALEQARAYAAEAMRPDASEH